MRFGSYLVQRGVVSPNAILEALKAQRSREPFVPLLAVELDHLSSSTALEILDRATDERRDFLEVAVETGQLNPAAAEKIRKAARTQVPQIGSLLVELGHLSAQRLRQHIKEYATE